MGARPDQRAPRRRWPRPRRGTWYWGATGPQNLRRHVQQHQEAAGAFRARLGPVLDGLPARGLSRRAVVVQLNALGVQAQRGGVWSHTQMQRLLSSRE